MADFSYYIEHNVCIVQISGQITIKTISGIKKDMEPLIEDVKKGRLNGIVMDCKKVDFIDSSGFGGICAKFVTLKKAGKKLRVVSLSANVQSFFDICKLSQTFETHKTVASLIQSMRPHVEPFKVPQQIGNWRPTKKKKPEKTLKGFTEDLKTVILKPNSKYL